MNAGRMVSDERPRMVDTSRGGAGDTHTEAGLPTEPETAAAARVEKAFFPLG